MIKQVIHTVFLISRDEGDDLGNDVDLRLRTIVANDLLYFDFATPS